MADTPPIITPKEKTTDSVSIEKTIDKLGGILSSFSKSVLGKAQEGVNKTTQTVLKSSITNALGPVSMMMKPIESFLNIDLGDKISGLFKLKGTGLFGSGKKFKGSINKEKIKAIDPGSVLIAETLVKTAEKDKKEFGMSKFFKLLLGGGLIAGALGILISGLMDNGPFKGLKKVVGLFLFRLGSKFMSAIVKPFRGLLDDVIKGIAPIFKKLFSPLRGLLKKLIRPFRGLIDNLVGFSGKIVGKTVGKLFGKGGGTVIKVFFKKMGKFIFKRLGIFTKGLKFIPGIGTLISIGYAISRFKSGDTLGGILDLASGIADIFPGLGTAIAWGLNIISAARDLGAFKKGGKVMKAMGSAGTFFKNMWKWVKSNSGPLLKVIGGTISNFFWAALDWVSDKAHELISLADSGISLGVDWIKSKILDPIMGWVSSTIGKGISLVSNIEAWIKSKLLSPLGSFFMSVWSSVTAEWTKSTTWAKNFIMTPISNFFNKIWNSIESAWKKSTNWIKTTFIDPIKGIFSSIFNVFAGLKLDFIKFQAAIGKGTIAGVTAGRKRLSGMGMSNSDTMSFTESLAGSRGITDAQALGLISKMSDRIIEALRNKKVSSVHDAIIRPNGEIIHTSPKDTLIATQSPIDRQMNRNISELDKSLGGNNKVLIVLQNLSAKLEELAKNKSSTVVQNNNYTSRFSPSNLMRNLTTEVY